ncbi:MAG: glycosyltransferase family 39 protein [Candidatus Peribacter sp.]|nr:glycosyltransferase family 39 protein [Candidatus Peribacter sp.]
MFILLLGILVRCYRFGAIPPGLNQDEASTGYDAFSLLYYGIDRNGFHNPLMLVSWGSGMYTLPVYLTMAVFRVVGMSVLSLRLVNLLFGIYTIIIFFRLVHKTQDHTLSLLAALLLVIAPWHIMISRWALDSNLFPAIFLFAVWCLAGGREQERRYVCAAGLLALSLYTYGTAYFVVPVFLLFVAAYLAIIHRLPSKKILWQSALLFLFIAWPVIAYLLINELHWSSLVTPLFSIPRLPGPPRYYAVSSIFSGDIVSHFSENIRTLGQLLLTGNDGLIWNAIPGFGYLYQFGLLFSLLGLLHFLFSPGKRREPVFILMFLWLCSAILLGIFESANINRINILFLPVIFFAAAGIRLLAVSRTALIGAILYFALSFVVFSFVYFGSYRARAAGAFFASFGEAVTFAEKSSSGRLCITDQVNQPSIFVLFYGQLDPRDFFRTVVYENPNGSFRNVRSFGRYTFGLDHCVGQSVGAYVLTPKDLPLIDPLLFEMHKYERFTVALPKVPGQRLPAP